MNRTNRSLGRWRRWNGMGLAVLLLMALAGGAALYGQTAPASPAGQAGAAAGAVTLPHVQPIVSMRDHTAKGATPAPKHKQSYDFTLKDTGWMDTGVTLAAGERASFTSTGKFSLADGRTTEPDGLARGWKDLLRQFPLNSANVGALVGRVSDLGASVPFLIGAKNDVVIPTSGRLFLRVNVSDDLAATGNYKVKVKFEPAKATAAALAPAAGVALVSGLITPETFVDIPRRVSDQAGNEGDMVNYALLGTEAQVKAAFKAAGWVAVDKTVEDAVLHGLLATLNHEAYTEMPMSTLYLFGRPQDLSFARGDPLKVAAERHHLRVWKTTKTIGGVPLWVGSATHDIGFEEDQRNGDVTHKIDPKIDDERDFLLHSFDAAGVFSSAAYVLPADPMLKAKTATGGSFYSDGRIVVMELK